MHVARRGEKVHAYGVPAGKCDGKRPLGKQGRRWEHKRMDPKYYVRPLTGDWTLRMAWGCLKWHLNKAARMYCVSCADRTVRPA